MTHIYNAINLQPVTVVAILNFSFEHEGGWPSDRYHSSYRLREDVTGEEMTDVIRYVFLELVRFKKTIPELETTFDKWMYLLRHMHKMTEIPEEFQEPEFKRLFLLAEIGNFTPDEMAQYLESLENMSDYYNIIDSAAELAEKRGREVGMAEGIVIGREEEKLTAARNFKRLGVALSTISEATGLSLEVIEGL